MRDQLKVEVTNEGVEVVFEDTAFIGDSLKMEQ